MKILIRFPRKSWRPRKGVEGSKRHDTSATTLRLNSRYGLRWAAGHGAFFLGKPGPGQIPTYPICSKPQGRKLQRPGDFPAEIVSTHERPLAWKRGQ